MVRVHVKVGWDGALHRLQFKEANTAKKANVPVLPSMFRGLSCRRLAVWEEDVTRIKLLPPQGQV